MRFQGIAPVSEGEEKAPGPRPQGGGSTIWRTIDRVIPRWVARQQSPPLFSPARRR